MPSSSRGALTREEVLRKKRKREKIRYAELKKQAADDPNLAVEIKRINKEKWLRRKEKKQVKIQDMTER